ncbi:MAG: TlpA family protein disulfide reductase, partial [Planctomycetaceae bacterium]|nr:TlpA family protein disulfide reductase [Planctomycetaceae bacterium]
RLRIARWNGILPTEQAVDQSHYQLADGTAVSGRIIRLTPDRQSFVVRHEDEETTIPAASVMTAELAFHFDGAYGPTTLILQDGSRVSGTLDSTRPGQLIVASPQVAEPLTVPHAEVRSVSIVHPDQQEPAPPTAGRTGRLELGDLRLHGALVPHVETAESHCLAFQPVGSRTSSPLSPDASGRIVYREAKRSKSQEEPRTTVSQPQPGRNFADLFLKKSKEPAPAKLPTAHELHLRSGDVIPCTIVAIDEHGLTIESSVATATHVPHDRVKAAKLAPRVSPPKLDDKKKDRLLTLPRLQKASPPTHLVVSKTGDFLRCRLMGLNETQVRVEVHLDEFDIPRERVTQIIWFHPDELTAETSTHTIPALDLSADDSSAPAQATAANTDDSDAGVGIGLVQAIERSGNRITFDPRQLDGTTLSGVSDVLGDCQVDIGQIDELIFGREIARAVASLDYQDWRLHPAVEPLIASEGDESGTADGAASPLVGQPAPEINLELLAGGRFRLSEHRGKIVLLDFWASWCGPCMQTMPLVEEAVAEFDPTQVMLVAVNLEEPAEHVQGVLQRHNMEMTVALDIDGAAARRYQANAIPQLVIVDRTGKVAKLYIGGGPQVVEQIKSTLQELLTLGDVTTP